MWRQLELEDGTRVAFHSRMLSACFIILSTTGFILLWGVMLLNGTLDAIDGAKKAGAFPDGRPLRSTYTGLPVLDSPLTTVVIFFDGVSNGSDLNARLLLIDFIFMLQSAALWALIESRRKGYHPLLFRMPSLWGVLSNGFGAAIIFPIYCLIHVRRRSANQASAVLLHEAKALLPTTALGLLMPFILILPPVLGCRVEHQQAFTALFQVSPLIFVGIQQVAARLIKTLDQGRERSDTDNLFVMGSYILAGLSSAAAHIYVMMVLLFTKNARITFSRVYFPSLAKIDQWAPSNITEGAHLFLQYDWIIIHLTCMLYAYFLLEPHLETLTRHLKAPSGPSKLVAQLLVIMTTIVLGPGTVVSFAFAAREYGLQKSSMAAKTG